VENRRKARRRPAAEAWKRKGESGCSFSLAMRARYPRSQSGTWGTRTRHTHATSQVQMPCAVGEVEPLGKHYCRQTLISEIEADRVLLSELRLLGFSSGTQRTCVLRQLWSR
jgi:hypothetical protein